MKVAHREPRKRRSFLSCTITDGYSEAFRLETEFICDVKVSFWRQKKGRGVGHFVGLFPRAQSL